MSGNASTRRALDILCVVSIPLSLWCFHLANHGHFPSGWIREIWGPQARTGRTGSAPDYMEWDIAAMLLMIAVCEGASLYLVVRLVWHFLARRRERSGTGQPRSR